MAQVVHELAGVRAAARTPASTDRLLRSTSAAAPEELFDGSVAEQRSVDAGVRAARELFNL